MRNEIKLADFDARKRAAPALMAFALAFAFTLAEPAFAQQALRPPVATILPDGSYDLAFDLPEGLKLSFAAWDPAGAHIAVYSRAGILYGEVWVDLGYGLEGPFVSVDDFTLSADGRRAACSVQVGYNEYWVLEGGRRSGPWADVVETAFSPDSTRFIFLGYSRETGGTEVVVDFVSQGRGYEPGFFANSRWYYRGVMEGPSVVTDAGVSGPWSYIPFVRVSPNASEILFSAVDTEGRSWVCTADQAYGPFLPFSQDDGTDGGVTMDLSALPFFEPGFAADGRTPRFYVREQRGDGIVWTVYEGAMPVGGPWPEPAELATFPVPSPNLERVAFIVREGAKFYIEEGDNRLGPFSDVKRLVYSADSSTLVAQVRGADWNGWLYGSGYKAGPYPYSYPDSWNLSSDGAFLRVEAGNRVGDDGKSGWWTREGELAEAPPGISIELKPDDPRYSPWGETTDSGTIVHGTALSFGPYEGVVWLFANTEKGGALYIVASGSTWTLYADGKLLLATRGDALGLAYPSTQNGIVPLLAGHRTVAWLTIVGGFPHSFSELDPDTGKGRWIDIGRDE